MKGYSRLLRLTDARVSVDGETVGFVSRRKTGNSL